MKHQNLVKGKKRKHYHLINALKFLANWKYLIMSYNNDISKTMNLWHL